MTAVLLAIALSTSAPAVSADADTDAWLRCARRVVEAQLASGTAAAWARAAAVPEGEKILYAVLEPRPSAEAFDAVRYVVQALPGRDQVYVSSSGGFADFRQVHGPIALEGRCAPDDATR